MIYKATYKWYDTNTFCTNIYEADSVRTVQEYLSAKHGIENPAYIEEATDSQINEAKRKGMPWIKLSK